MSDFLFIPLRPFYYAALAKRWKVQFRKGLRKFNNVDSKTTYFNENCCIIYMYVYIYFIARIIILCIIMCLSMYYFYSTYFFKDALSADNIRLPNNSLLLQIWKNVSGRSAGI